MHSLTRARVLRHGHVFFLSIAQWQSEYKSLLDQSTFAPVIFPPSLRWLQWPVVLAWCRQRAVAAYPLEKATKECNHADPLC